MNQLRKAVVFSSSPSVESYLPRRYNVVRVDEQGNRTYIEGIDFRGWTLDGYVIPRLASGRMRCEEIAP